MTFQLRRGADKAFANAKSLGGVPLKFAWLPKPAQPAAQPAAQPKEASDAEAVFAASEPAEG